MSAKTAIQHQLNRGTQGGSYPPRCLATEKLTKYLGDFGLGVDRVLLRVPSLYFLSGRCVDGIEEFPTHTVNNVSGACVPKAMDGLPEFFRG